MPASLHPAEVRLDGEAVPQALLLVLRGRAEGIERCARDTERDAGNPGREQVPVDDAVEEAGMIGLHVHVELPVVGNEEVLHRVAVAAGAAEADHVPGFMHVHVRFREQEHAHDGRSVGLQLRVAVGIEERAAPAHPGRVARAAGEKPFAADAPSVPLANGAAARQGAPGQHRIGVAADHQLAGLGRQIGHRHRADRALAQDPCRARVAVCDRLDGAHEGGGIDLVAAQLARHQEAEHPCFVESGEDRSRQALRGVDLGGSRLDHRQERLHPRHPVDGLRRQSHALAKLCHDAGRHPFPPASPLGAFAAVRRPILLFRTNEPPR